MEPRAAQRPATMASHAVLSPRVTTRVASPARVSSSARSASRSRPPRAPRVRSAELADALVADAPDSHDDGATIAAIATPVVPPAGGGAIIRLSGPDAVAAARAVFRPASRDERDAAARGDPLRSHVAVYGTVRDDDEIIDEVLLLPMLAPRSYTAEDVVEIHCHGGSVCVQRVLALLLRDAPPGSDSDSARPSVRLARPGEFTLRAFLNGRLDLTQAEAVQALVSARTDAAADGALAALRGGLAGPVRAARASCVDLLAELEARLDFDDEMEPLDEDDVAARVMELERVVEDILSTARRGRLMESGVSVAIVGRPNAGKSSLLNAWSRTERAIVTDVEGTTRDVVEASVTVAGMPVNLLDTAGIRGETSDAVEAIGVERSRVAARGADVVVMVVDGARGWRAEDDDIWRDVVAADSGVGPEGEGDEDEDEWARGEEIDAARDEFENAKARLFRARGGLDADGNTLGRADSSDATRRDSPAVAILAVNKVDAVDDVDAALATIPPLAAASFSAIVRTSAREGEGVRDLEEALATAVGAGDVAAEGSAWAANQRQAEAMRTALSALARLRGVIRDGLPVDFWTIELREAAMALGAITGDDVTEDILDVIFTRFCIGK